MTVAGYVRLQPMHVRHQRLGLLVCPLDAFQLEKSQVSPNHTFMKLEELTLERVVILVGFENFLVKTTDP